MSREWIEGSLKAFYNEVRLALQESLQCVVNDPLMKCFSQGEDSRAFMLDRIKEIYAENMKIVAFDYIETLQGKLGQYEAELGQRGAGAKVGQSQGKDDRESAKLTNEIEALRRITEEQEHQIAYLRNRSFGKGDLLVAKDNVVDNNHEKLQENERLSKKIVELEKAVQKLEFKQQTDREQYDRDLKKVVEDNEILEKKVKQMNKLSQSSMGKSKENAPEKERTHELELKVNQLKDRNESLQKQVEDVEFCKSIVEDHMAGLKEELKRQNESCLCLKRENSELEIELLETKNKYSEATVTANRNSEEAVRLSQEVA